jgi:dTDP-4-dehydrorhamnose reductase
MTLILVTGASGLLGLNLALMESGRHVIIGVDRNTLVGTPFELIRAELLDPLAQRWVGGNPRGQNVQRILDAVRPDAVIHTAAIANIDACESDPLGAQRLNAEFPGELAEACVKRNIRLVHISTDAIFDGSLNGIYTENDTPNPLGVYAQTKLAGERNVMAASPQAIVARVNFFGWSISGTRSLSEFFFNKLSAGEQCSGFTDTFFCPLFVGDLAEILILMLNKELSGLYHVIGSEALSKYDFGQRIARQFGFDPGLVIPKSVEESGLKARRSHNLRLSIHKLSTDLGIDIPGASTGIEKFYTQSQQGYPQKMRSYQQF